MKNVRMGMLRITLVLLAAVTAPRLQAMERDWVAHEAEVIVIGTFQSNPTYPWFDGWHITGTITVDDVLYGPAQMPRVIRFEQICPWSTCQRWPPPIFRGPLLDQGIWFLRHIDGNRWHSSIGPHYFGFGTLSELEHWQEYIRTKKIHPWPGFGKKTSTY